MNLKKILAGVLACCVISGTLPVVTTPTQNTVITASASGEYTEGTYESLNYKNYGDHIEISGCDFGTEGEIIIPETIEGLPVTKIESSAFNQKTSITSVKIPESVESIGSYAFYRCTKLESVNIPSKVKRIEQDMFVSCSSLKSITLPERVESIGAEAFYGCTKLESVTIKNPDCDLGAIGTICNGFDEDGMPYFNGIIYGYEGSAAQAFAEIYGYKFKSLEISTENPADVLEYENHGDYIEITGCDTSATEVVIPAEIDGLPVTSIGGVAFMECEGLTEVIIPDSVISIGGYAFASCFSLTEITIPDSVTSIGARAFGGCKGLKDISIPDSVTSIGQSAFEYTPWLETRQKENPLVIVNGILIDGTTCSGKVVIPDSVTRIEDYAFLNCAGLTEVTLPDSVTSIGVWEFAGCTKLTEITIPENVTSIKYAAFAGCNGLEKITILNPDCEIDDDIDTISNDHDAGGVYFNGTIYGYENSTAQAYAKKYNRTFESLGDAPEVPADVLEYENHGDYIEITGCDKSATSVVIPAEIDGLPVTSIGDFAFNGCELTSITIPDSVTSIGANAFQATPWLEARRKEDPLVVINKILIDGKTCSGDVIIPDGVTSISDYAFSNCSELTGIIIPESVIRIDVGAFEMCCKLTSVNIPDGITSIGGRAFSGCTKLTLITIPDSVTSIDEFAFGYSGLTEVTIPDSVTNISEGAFGDCSELKTITILNPECGIADNEDTISNSYDEGDDYKPLYSGVIKGYSGSTAEAYAKKYNKTFEAIIETEFILGDVTQDGIINGSDATLALRAYTLTSASLDDELDDIQFKAADVDGDGQLTGSDATLILRYYTLLSSITDGSTLPPIEEWIKNS